MDVLLITMPWDSVVAPSIALGTLKVVLERAGISSEVRHWNLAFLDYLSSPDAEWEGGPPRRRVGVSDYMHVLRNCDYVSMGDWIFCIAPFREDTADVDAQYIPHALKRGLTQRDIDLGLEIRRAIPGFMRKCVADVISSGVKVVGVSTMFSQNVASLLFAKMLKAAAPDVKIIFGGANCDGPMGEGLHRGFPYVDAIVRGEGERILPELVRDVLAGRPFRPLPGVCIRNGDEATIVPQPSGRQVPMNEVPMPDYDDYFRQLEATPFGRNVRPHVRLLFETSRGCWWGEKNHCSFCGLNGSAMTFNSKPADQAFEEVTTLSNKYEHFTFDAVDNIIDMEYLKTFLPRFRDSGIDLRLFYETKANLKREQLRLMRDSGLRAIQPGVESLSTPVLKLMRKGVTALQNIRLLKWCREFGIRVQWNLLYGLPHEPREEYDRIADVIPSLWHFPPPNLVPLLFCKFSPYFDKATEMGVKITGPQPQYLMIYPLDRQTVHDIAYNFDGVLLDGRDPEAYMDKCRAAVDDWKRRYNDRGGAQRYTELQSLETSGLSHREGAGFVQISDLRGCTSKTRHVLKGWQAAAFLACDAGATVAGVAKALHTAGIAGVKDQELERFLASLVTDRLLYEEDGKFLALSVSVNPDADRFRAAMQPSNDEMPVAPTPAPTNQKLISLSRRP